MKSCPIKKENTIDKDLAELYPFPESHKDGTKMALLSEAVMERHKDIYARVPFCNTVEAESMGAWVRLGDNGTTPLIREATWSSLEDVKICPIDPTTGRMGEVIKAIKHLKAVGVPVALEMSGPFSVLMGILDSRTLFKAMRKAPDTIETYLDKIGSNLAIYMKEAVQSGLTMVSIAEPAGTSELVGPKVFSKTVAPSLLKLMDRFETIEGDWAGHICGRLSSSMVEEGLLKEEVIEIDCETYGEGLEESRKEGIKWFGGNCIAMTSKPCKKIRIIRR